MKNLNMKKNTIRLTESELITLVKRVVNEQRSVVKGASKVIANIKSVDDKYNSVKPDQGGKYCFSKAKLKETIKAIGSKYTILYKLKTGDTLSALEAKAGGDYVNSMNPDCDLKTRFRAGDVVMWSARQSS